MHDIFSALEIALLSSERKKYQESDYMRVIFFIVLLIVIAIPTGIQAQQANVNPRPAWPTSKESAALAFGVEGHRSSVATNWISFTRNDIQYWGISPQSSTIFVPLGYRIGCNRTSSPSDGNVVYTGPNNVTSPYDCALFRTTYALDHAPANQREAADAFGVVNHRSAQLSQWQPHPTEANTWVLQTGDTTELFVPPGAWIEGGTIPATYGERQLPVQGVSVRLGWPNRTFAPTAPRDPSR
jgi:hypothetical protein